MRVGDLALLVVFACALGSPRTAVSKPIHPRFEPDDLELEAPGTIELDVQIGAIRGATTWRTVAPDLEVDVGILPNLELDLGWTYAFEVPRLHSTPDNLWLSTKVGLFSRHDDNADKLWALGLQVGPHLPVVAGATRPGWESLLLIGRMTPGAQVVLNVGGVIEPQAGAYQLGLETGFTLDLPLDQRGTFGIGLALASVYFFSHDPSQLTATATFNWMAAATTTLSLTVLAGFTSGSDRFGVLLGVAQKVRRPRR